MHAWHGKMLLVDLSKSSVRTEALDRNTLAAWIGGRGLGVHLIRDFITLDPYDPSMPLIFAVGPLCGTPAAASSRMSVVSRSPLTGTIGESSVGGSFPQALKSAGYDCVIVSGAANKPVYLEIIDGTATIR
ncbi:MAG TPA: aldehyde:ferredoxin oxidoreductase, partial [Nitrospiraceae bacterium]|nr:aldehyde:ferredoxin oxidoreductase [Nitrospiraceae bacterium]